MKEQDAVTIATVLWQANEQVRNIDEAIEQTASDMGISQRQVRKAIYLFKKMRSEGKIQSESETRMKLSSDQIQGGT